MTEEEERAWKQCVVLFLWEACPDVSKFEEWPLCEQWVSHALLSVRWLEEAVVQTEVAACVCNQAGYYLRVCGRYQEAEPLYRRAWEICEQALGAGHPNTAMSVNNLVLLYDAQGRYEEAEPMLKRAVMIMEQRVGVQHPNTRLMRKNYVGVLRALGREEEAAALEAEGD